MKSFLFSVKPVLVAVFVFLMILTLCVSHPMTAEALQYNALLVGMDDWANDVDDMHDAMLAWDENFWFDENITVMKNPTGEQVLNEIESLIVGSDFFFFGYTGHGSYGPGNEINAYPVDPLDEYLCTHGSWISDDQLYEALSPSENPVLVALDSCYSGGFWGGQDEGDLERLQNGSLFAASPEYTTAPGSSPLWNNLVNGAGSGAADLNNDLTITLGEWYDYSQSSLSVLFDDDGLLDTALFSRADQISPVSDVPEPSTMVLMFVGILFSGIALRRKKD